MSNDQTGPTEAGAIAELAVKAAGGPSLVLTSAGREFLCVPERAPEDVTEANAVKPLLPGHISQSVTVQTLDSLVDYVNRFRTDTTILFADIANNALRAVIDYHGADAPAFAKHAAKLSLPFSVEWATWSAIDGKLLSQLDFARFLEENAGDVVAPSGADLLDACRDLQAVRKVNFTKAIRTASDNESFEYTDDTTANVRKGGVEVPTKFQLSLPVYFGGASVDPCLSGSHP